MNFSKLFKRKISDSTYLAAAKQTLREEGPFYDECVRSMAEQFPDSHPYVLYRQLRLAMRDMFGKTWLSSSVFENQSKPLYDLSELGSPATPEGHQWQQLEFSQLKIEFQKLLIVISVEDMGDRLNRRNVELELVLAGYEVEDWMMKEALVPDSKFANDLSGLRDLRRKAYKLIESHQTD